MTDRGDTSVMAWIYCSSNLPHFSFWIHNLDDELIELLMVQCNDYRVVRIVYIIEDTSAMLIKRTGGDDTRNLSARHTKAMPPSTCGFRVYRRTGNVYERDSDLTPERPELIHSLDIEDSHPIGDRYLDQTHASFERRGKKIRRSRIERNKLYDSQPSQLLGNAASVVSLDFYNEVLNVAGADTGDAGDLGQRARSNRSELVTRFESE